MPGRELDAEIAERVMGLTVNHGYVTLPGKGGLYDISRYTTDANDDQIVARYIQKRWDAERLRQVELELHRIWERRVEGLSESVRQLVSRGFHEYRGGDISRAALEVLNKEKNNA